MARFLTALPFVSRKFARRPQLSVAIGGQGQRFHLSLRWLVLGACVLVVASAGWWLFKAHLFSIDQIVLDEQVHVAPEIVPIGQLQHLLTTKQGQSLLWLDTQSLAKQLQQDFPSVADWRISKQYPHRLVVGYLPRVALCQLETQSGMYLVDRNGLIFGKGRSEVLPTLTANVKPVIGKSISVQGVSLGLALIEGLRSTTPKLEQVKLQNRELDLRLASQPAILINQDRDSQQALTELRALLATFAIENKYPKEVDMRYDRPVLRY